MIRSNFFFYRGDFLRVPPNIFPRTTGWKTLTYTYHYIIIFKCAALYNNTVNVYYMHYSRGYIIVRDNIL